MQSTALAIATAITGLHANNVGTRVDAVGDFGQSTEAKAWSPSIFSEDCNFINRTEG